MPFQLLLDGKKPWFHVPQKGRCRTACRTGGSPFSVLSFDLHEILRSTSLSYVEIVFRTQEKFLIL